MTTVSALALVPSIQGFKRGWMGLYTKERGIVLPGGKFEAGKDANYHEAARRELFEETGLTALDGGEYIFSGPDITGNYTVFTFLFKKISGQPYDKGVGTPMLATWDDFYESKFQAYFRCLKQVLDQKGFRL